MSKTKIRSAQYSINEYLKQLKGYSFASRADMRHMLNRCIKDLHELGFNLTHIKGLKPKHIHVLVEHWKTQNKNPATIKNYMAKLRKMAILLDKPQLVKPSNDTYQISRRSYVPTHNKAIHQVDFSKCTDPMIRLSLEAQSLFGLRREESMKLIISEAWIGDSLRIKPFSILREAITNALCHREYSYTGGSVSFAIYDDRIEIWSYGLLPPGLSIDELGELNQSIPRNRRIANVLYYHKLFESWGRGICLILDGCVEAGHPLPVYSINSGGLLLSMPTALTTGTELPKKPDYKELTDRQQEIIILLKRSSGLSTAEIHSQLSSPPTERWLRDELNKLKANEYIDSIGSTTTKKWYVKE